MSGTSERAARAARLRGYFDLQLRFAAVIAEIRGLPLAEAVGFYTNFHRRFGLGAIETQGGSAAWRGYVDRLRQCATQDARVDWTQKFFLQAPEETLPADQRRFGCFSCAPPSTEGLVRFHFANDHSADGVSALSRLKADRRRQELAAMFAHIRVTFPHARNVRGISWLYHVEAYRRLFPPEFGASRAPPERPMRLNGSSSWGQFLDHREAIKPGLRDAFLAALPSLDAERPWRSFPLPVLQADAPIARFYDFYGL